MKDTFYKALEYIWNLWEKSTIFEALKRPTREQFISLLQDRQKSILEESKALPSNAEGLRRSEELLKEHAYCGVLLTQVRNNTFRSTSL